MVGHERKANSEWGYRRRSGSGSLALARAGVPSLLFHLGAAWAVWTASPAPRTEVDARLDGTLTFVTLEAERPASVAVAEAGAVAPAPPEKTELGCCDRADLSPRKLGEPAEQKTPVPQEPDPDGSDRLPAGATVAVEPTRAEAASKTDALAAVTPVARKKALEATESDKAIATTQAVEDAAGDNPLATEAASIREDLVSSGSPAHVSPGVAASLRVYDTFPRMPEPLRRSSNPLLVVMNVCVSAEGRVDDVRISAGANPMLARSLREAVNTWRYRPLMMGEGPTPFCHEMGVSYRVR